VDMCPLVNQCPHDKQAEDRRPFRQFLQEATTHIFNDIDTFGVTIRYAVVTGCQTHQVKQDEEQQRTYQAAAHRDTGTQCCKDRTYGSPEDRVAYTSQRPHQTDLDTGDSTVVDLCAISTLFFQRQGYAENRRSHER